MDHSPNEWESPNILGQDFPIRSAWSGVLFGKFSSPNHMDWRSTTGGEWHGDCSCPGIRHLHQKVQMLRLTRTNESPAEVVLKAEGQITSEWVKVLEDEVLQLGSRARQVVLDLADVNYLDRRGVRLIRTLAAGPVSLVNCSPLVEELLAEDTP